MDSDPSLRTIFNAALEQDDPAERLRYLEGACGKDTGLREKVIELLDAYDEAGGFFSNPSIPSASRALHSLAEPVTEKTGDTIGRYKLLQQIGEGGCGVVYMAEQEEPVRRRVALKVIKLGMDTRSVIARFEAERQALALMDHPNIARVLDAGATDTGRPYFVMELVRGIKITEYCDQNNLATVQRLALFNQVCSAVQHAHQKGIIHRDLKPSNILVTLHDGVPVPKVIDFGIAKATTGQRLTDKTLFTAFEQFIGTPAYMSPEQAEMSGLDIDTRSDIYALGVLLYELLTGQTPFDAKELLSAGLDAMRRTIREQEPARPSTRLSTMLAADLTTIARQRQSDSLKLTHAIRGDLDWIVMKALEKDRTRRYDTASSLASDIQRHLENEPVTARPPTNLYRVQKLVRRNKRAVAAVSAVAVTLVLGIVASTWQAVRATRAEQEQGRLRAEAQENAKAAQTEASKSKQVTQFLEDMLKGVGPSVALGRDTKMLREILDKTVERLGEDLKDQPEVEAELRYTLGEVYRELGDFETAGAMDREALAAARKLWGNGHANVAAALTNLALVLNEQGKLAEAEAAQREALGIQRKLLGDEHPSVAKALDNLGGVLWLQGRLAEAESLHREGLAMRRKLLGNEHRDVAASLNNLANVLKRQDKLAEAETMHREAVAMTRKLFGDVHPYLASSLNNLASVLMDEGKLAEAEAMYREALAMQRKLFGNEHQALATSLNNLASVLEKQGDLSEAESMYRESLAMRTKLFGNEHPDVASSLNNLAIMFERQKKFSEAEAMHREALAMNRKLLGNEHPAVANSLHNLAAVLALQGKSAEAETMYRAALAMSRKLLGYEHRAAVRSFENLAGVLRDQGKLAEFEALLREELEIVRNMVVKDPARLQAILSDLAKSLYRRNEFAEAEVLLREGNEAVQHSQTVDSKLKRNALTRLVRLYQAWDKPDKVAEWQQKLDAFDTAEAKAKD